jgi:hypothetical protein
VTTFVLYCMVCKGETIIDWRGPGDMRPMKEGQHIFSTVDDKGRPSHASVCSDECLRIYRTPRGEA